MSRKDGGRDQDVTFASQGRTKVVNKLPEAKGEAWNKSSLTAFRRDQLR